MKLGDIYYFVTDQAAGHDQRHKYHVYLDETGWRADGHSFLFISKTDYGGDYRIRRADYPFFPLNESFVSCGDFVTYSASKLAGLNPEYKGQLRPEHLREIYAKVRESDTMEGWKIKVVCDILKNIL